MTIPNGDKLIGDSRPSSLYGEYIGEDAAQDLVNEIIEVIPHWLVKHRKPVKVVYTEKVTKRLWGKFRQQTMYINAHGENIGTIVHEITHNWASGHGRYFKDVHEAILNIVE